MTLSTCLWLNIEKINNHLHNLFFHSVTFFFFSTASADLLCCLFYCCGLWLCMLRSRCQHFREPYWSFEILFVLNKGANHSRGKSRSVHARLSILAFLRSNAALMTIKVMVKMAAARPYKATAIPHKVPMLLVRSEPRRGCALLPHFYEIILQKKGGTERRRMP